MTAADGLLPQYQFFERHTGRIEAPPHRVLDAIETLTDRDDPLLRLMIQLREAPSRLAGLLGAKHSLKGAPRFGMDAFARLLRSDTELVYGLVGRFWRPSFGLKRVASPEDFAAFAEPGVAKLLMRFAVEPEAEGGLRLVTETRVFCPDKAALRAFTPYWWAIRAGSGLIRRRMLAIVKRKAEAAA